jgi:hypothetical protein
MTVSQTITITQIGVEQPQTVSTQAASQSQPTGPYVFITYSPQTANSLYVTATGLTYTPHIPGDVYLILNVKVENNGYSVVYLSLADFYVIISGEQYSYADYIAYTYTWLPSGGVFNGLSVTGNLVYEVPPNYGTFVLFWNHPPDVSVIYSGTAPST